MYQNKYFVLIGQFCSTRTQISLDFVMTFNRYVKLMIHDNGLNI